MGNRLHDEEKAIHAGVNAREAAPIGVHVESAAGIYGATGDEATAFALWTEPEVLEKEDRVDGEGVVKHEEADVLPIYAGHLECALAALNGGGDSEIRH